MSTYLIIEGDFPFWRGFLCQQWRRLPVRTVLLSQAPALWRQADYDAVESLPLDGPTLDPATLKERLAGYPDLSGALTVFEPAVARTLEIQRALGLPPIQRGPDGRALRNKARMVEVVKGAGLATPATVSGDHVESLAQRALATLTFPMVVKPAELAGKAGVRLVREPGELRAAIQEALAETLPFEIDGRPTSVVELFGCERMALVQEYIEGPEFSIEGYASRGRIEVLAITEKLSSGPPRFEELGHLQPARLGAAEERAVREYAVAAGEAFGLEHTFFHLELRVRAGTCVLMELNCRLGGDLIGRLLELRSGMNLGATLLALAAGDPVAPPPRWSGAAGVRMITTPLGGRIHSLRAPVVRSELEAALFEHGVGSVIAPPRPGGVARIGACLAWAATADAVDQRLDQLTGEILVEMAPAEPAS